MTSAVAKNTGCKGSYSLMKLPHHNRMQQCVPDAMHTVKDVIERLFHLIIGKNSSSKVQQAEKNAKRVHLVCEDDPSVASQKSRKKIPCYQLSPDDIKIANTRINSVILPLQDFTPSNTFSRTFGLKSHDWKEVIFKSCNFVGVQYHDHLISKLWEGGYKYMKVRNMLLLSLSM